MILPNKQEREEIAQKAHEYFDGKIYFGGVLNNKIDMAIVCYIVLALALDKKGIIVHSVSWSSPIPSNLATEQEKISYILLSSRGYTVRRTGLDQGITASIKEIHKEAEELRAKYRDNYFNEFVGWMDELQLKYKDLNVEELIFNIYFHERFEIATFPPRPQVPPKPQSYSKKLNRTKS